MVWCLACTHLVEGLVAVLPLSSLSHIDLDPETLLTKKDLSKVT